MNEQIDLRYDHKNGSFNMIVNETIAAQMTFVFAGDKKIIIDHTEVNNGYNGKGYGKILVAKAVDFARGNKLKIIPLCPFVKSIFDKTPDYNDVL